VDNIEYWSLNWVSFSPFLFLEWPFSLSLKVAAHNECLQRYLEGLIMKCEQVCIILYSHVLNHVKIRKPLLLKSANDSEIMWSCARRFIPGKYLEAYSLETLFSALESTLSIKACVNALAITLWFLLISVSLMFADVIQVFRAILSVPLIQCCGLLFYSLSLLTLRPCVGLGLLHGYVAVIFFRSGVSVPRPTSNPKIWRNSNYTSSGPYPLTCMAWMALPGAYVPTSIALRLSGASKSPLHDKAVVLEEGYCIISSIIWAVSWVQ
jgi:hypothetical protein